MPAHPVFRPWKGKAATAPVAGEEKLVRRAQGGDASAFGTLYEAYVDRIYRYVFYRVSDNATAEDITAQTFLKAWDRLDSFQLGRAPFVGWIYRIAHNAIIDYYRGVKAEVPLDDARPSGRPGEGRPSRAGQTRELDDQLELHLETLRLRTALQKLTEDQQQVIILKFILGLDTSEIALHLGKEPGAVRALQMRALQSLARSLQPETE